MAAFVFAGVVWAASVASAQILAQTDSGYFPTDDAGSLDALLPALAPAALSPASRIVYPDGGAAPFIIFGAGSAADYDGDGLVDFADHNSADGTFYVHLNQGSGSFNTTNWGGSASPNGTTAHGAGWEWLVGSFSSSHRRADFVDHWLPSGQFWVHKNLGDGGFAPSGTNWGGGYTHSTQGSGGDPGWEFFAGDFNNDGWADIVEHYRPTGEFWVYQNYQDGGFGSPTSGTGVIAHGFTAVGPRWSMAVSDFNNDGYADYADVRFDMYGDTPDAGVWIHLAFPDGGFDSTPVVVGPADAGSEVELLAGNWEQPVNGYNSSGAFQYMLHDVPTGTFTAVEYYSHLLVRSFGFTEGSSTGATSATGATWETLGTSHYWTQMNLKLDAGGYCSIGP